MPARELSDHSWSRWGRVADVAQKLVPLQQIRRYTILKRAGGRKA